MKTIHNRTIYDTDKALLVYETGDDTRSDSNPRAIVCLYRSEKGNWFLYTSRRDKTMETIEPFLTPEQVIDWLEERGQDEILFQHFADHLFEA